MNLWVFFSLLSYSILNRTYARFCIHLTPFEFASMREIHLEIELFLDVNFSIDFSKEKYFLIGRQMIDILNLLQFSMTNELCYKLTPPFQFLPFHLAFKIHNCHHSKLDHLDSFYNLDFFLKNEKFFSPFTFKCLPNL